MIKQLLSMRPKKLEGEQDGLILITIIIVVSALMIVGFALISSTTSQFLLTRNDSFTADALSTAEAGIEQSVQQLNSNDGFTGYSTPQQFFNNTSQGYGVFTVSVAASPSDGNAKIITSTGKVYRNSSASTLISTKIVRVTAVGTQSQGYSVQAGPGGLIMGGSAHITNSDVYVGGTIQMSGAAQIGTDSKPANVYAGNYACPAGNSPGATYPSPCSGTQPIPITDWSSVAIIGTTCATGQTQSKFPNSIYNTGQPQIRAGSSGGSGLQVGCTAPQVSQPTYDRSAQIAAVTTTKPSSDSSIDCTQYSGSQGFTRTWPANLKITGNVDVGSSCNLTINGNVYITGNLTIDGAAKITVANSLGTTRPVVIVDGTISAGGAAQLIANSSGTGIEFISFKSTASCNPNCTSLSGNDLKTSSGTQTVSIGGGASLPGMIFDAYWGKIVVTGSGNVGSAVGQTIDMSGAGTVTFGTTLSSGSSTWTISSYQELYPSQL
jgi:hypothetical protein